MRRALRLAALLLAGAGTFTFTWWYCLHHFPFDTATSVIVAAAVASLVVAPLSQISAHLRRASSPPPLSQADTICFSQLEPGATPQPTPAPAAPRENSELA